tara:strand:- start:249 stop:713 length:465 start_codon:yes stop_codon:yes gene_type:complete
MKNNNIKVYSNKDYVKFHNTKADVVTRVCLKTGKINIYHPYGRSVMTKTHSELHYTDIECNGDRMITITDSLHIDEVTSGPEQEENLYVDTLYVDEGADDTTGLFTVYTEKDALKLIRDLMSEDEHLPEYYKKGDCSDDDAFEYASNHYSIYRK